MQIECNSPENATGSKVVSTLRFASIDPKKRGLAETASKHPNVCTRAQSRGW
jgi:hypothetical protein